MKAGLEALSTILDAIKSPALIVTGDGILVLGNKRFWSWDQKDAVLSKLRSPAGCDILAEILRQSEARPARFTFEGKKDLFATGRRLSDENNNVLLRFGGHEEFAPIREVARQRQITDKEIARRLEVEGQAEVIFDAASDGIVLVSNTGEVLRANKAFGDMVGASADLLKGVELSELVDLSAGNMPDFWKRADEAPFVTEGQLRLTSGPVPVEMRIARTIWRNAVSSVVIIRDYRDSQLATAAMKRAAELEGANKRAQAAERARTRLVSVMSHEMRTPLNGLLLTTEMLLEDEALTPDQRHLIEIIARSSETALDQVTNVLAFVRSEEGFGHVPPRPFRPAQVLKDIIEQQSAFAQKEGSTLELELGQGESLWLKGKAPLFFSIAQNLISNAIKATKDGQINVTYSAVLRGKMVQVMLSVTDTGVGIDPSRLDKVWQPFETDAKYGDTRRGAGIGLSIVRNALDELNATVQVDSEVDGGTHFEITFELPLAKGRNIASPRTSQATDSDRRLLIVDDNATNREILLALSRRLNIYAVGAEDGRDALGKLASVKPDVIVMDLSMPVMDGYDATRRIRLHPDFANIPIIAATAFISEEVEERCREVGMTRVIEKPIRLTDLEEIMGVEANVNDEQYDLDVSRFVSRAMAEADRDLPAILEAHLAGDVRVARDIAHRLLGVIRALNVADLVQPMIALEQACRTGEGDVPQLVQTAQKAMEEVRGKAHA
jgi:signal transduction histidine kinase/FixJ family two-component response regulator